MNDVGAERFGHLCGRVGPSEHRADIADQMGHDTQPRAGFGNVPRYDVNFMSTSQQPLGMLISDLFGAATMRIEMIDDQSDFHRVAPAAD